MSQQSGSGRTALSHIITLTPRPHASASIEYDTPSSIGDYIPNAAAIDAIGRFTAGIGSGVALSITGPYGSGKSTFGVVLSHLVAPSDSTGWNTVYARIRHAAPEIADVIVARRKAAGLHETGMIRCIAAARLEPVAATILRAAENGARSYFGSRYGRKHFDEAAELRRRMKDLRKGKIPEASVVSRIVTSLASACPVLLILDEFGKNIEYFTYNNDDGDLFLLQELAEMSGKSRSVPLHMVTIQHMAFGEYVAGTQAGRIREWAKIQGRFDDIHFTNSLEHMRAIISSCINHGSLHDHVIWEWASDQAETASREAGYEIPVEIAASCYPLHPLAVAALPELCARYGQNNRTLLSFITGGGPGTVARFIETEKWDGKSDLPSIGMDALYDYFIAGQTTIRPGPGAAPRLVEIGTIIRDAEDMSPSETRSLKTIGLMNLIGRSGRLRASLGMIRCVAGSDAEQAVRSLDTRSLVTYRRHADEYRVWHGTDVNIAAKLDAWRKTSSGMMHAALMETSMKPEPVVAARHAMETGALRIFGCFFGGHDLNLGAEYDGAVVYGTPDTQMPVCDRPVVVARCSDVLALHKAALEVLALRAVLDDDDVKGDWVAKGEVAERLTAAESKLSDEFDLAYGVGASWSCGAIAPDVKIDGPAGPAVSQACDITYTRSPTIRNEMINRNRLTAQGSTTLNRLMAACIKNFDKPHLGIEGWGPERAVYEAIMSEYRLHKEAGNTFVLVRPHGGNLAHTWNVALERLRRSHKAVQISEIFDIWRLPPLGIKRGVMSLLALLVIISMRTNLALYEHGSYVSRINASLAERLVKNPQHFSLKYFRRTAARMELIRQTAEALGVDQTHGVLGIVSYAVDIIRVLPAYTRRTKNLGKNTLAVRNAIQNAVEPDTLLFESIPEALGFSGGEDGVKKDDIPVFATRLAEAIKELQTAFDSMRGRMYVKLLAETKAADRTSLAKTASVLLPNVSDQRMKVFLRAISADIPDDKEWIGYVALTLTDRPPTEWSDEYEQMFENGLREVTSNYLRLAAMRFDDVTKNLKEPSVMVTITHPDGHEERVILPVGDRRITELTK